MSFGQTIRGVIADNQCSKTCPKGLNPAAAIAKMKLEMATNADAA
jgi:succinate dehydrogenase/fumarate reductase-like Fe-S protein